MFRKIFSILFLYSFFNVLAINLKQASYKNHTFVPPFRNYNTLRSLLTNTHVDNFRRLYATKDLLSPKHLIFKH